LSTARRLIALTVCVLIAHALLLGGVPSVFQLFTRAPDMPTEPAVSRFVMRTLAPDVVPAPAPAMAAPLRKPAPPSREKPPAPAPPAATAPPTAVAAEPADAVDAAPSAAPDATGVAPQPADSSTGTALASNAPTSQTHGEPPAQVAQVAQVAQAAPAAQATPATVDAAPAATRQAAAVSFPEPIRLLFDGKGEERGFMKYAASAELLWLHDGAQYNTRMEISAWGFRVRTWTSKGALGDTGLAPLRFGDKPRGAELATHFQRDKNIISFSANNPDVPLQAGAQDKLSALLQLSALVAGAPDRYPNGNSIRFQAADAHRAEVWEFKVGGLELLDLPGGPKQAIKLSKSPTVEFDQGIEVWLAPDMQYLPVRLRITEANGAFADLLWRKTQNAE
jgi:hypothetical protein